MKPIHRSLTALLILTLFLALNRLTFAQEAASAAPSSEATEVFPTENSIVSPRDTPTLVPSDITTDLPTALSADTPTFTPSPSEAATEDLAATQEVVPSQIPSPTATAQTFPPEPGLASWFSDTFDRSAASAWTLNGNWAAENGALKLVINGGTANLSLSPVQDEAVQLRVLLSEGSGIQISLQESGNGGYAVLLRSDGQVGLYRAGALLQFAQVQPFALGDWHTLRLSAVGGIVRVSVDANQVITFQDMAALSPGTINLMGFAAGELLVDDFSVFVPPDQLPPPTVVPSPTFVATATAVVLTPEVTPMATAEATMEVTVVPPTPRPRVANGDLPLATAQQSVNAQGVTFVVNTTEDDPNLTNPSNCDTPELLCTLRAAIQRADEVSGADTITFKIPGSGVHTILLYSTLQIHTSVIIDGTTQPGYGDKPMVEIRPLHPADSLTADGLYILNSDGVYDSSLTVTIQGLTINGFSGIALNIGDGQNHLIEDNFIGTDASGTLSLNNNSGILLSARNSIIQNNVISGNTSSGISLRSSGPHLSINNIITGNFIGTNFGGTAAIPNHVGIDIADAANNNTIGGVTPTERNIISGNAQYGISITGNSTPALDVTGIVIQGNYIGTNGDGTAKLGNNGSGIYIQQSGGNTIGGSTGTTPGGNCNGACNLISGNQNGIVITNSSAVAQGNTVIGNFIGTDATGKDTIPNVTSGININGNANTIGGTTPSARNLISGNKGSGISIAGAASSGNQVLGNYIGTDTTGTLQLGNQSYGVFIRSGASNNNVGNKTAAGANRIAFNGISGNQAGVGVEDGSANLIATNEIYSNYGLGIDLLPEGVTPNDTGDADTGANERQNFPVLNVVTQATTVISGTLNSKPDTTYRIEFYSSEACDSSGYGEGQTLLGFLDVITDGSGNTPTFTYDVGSALPMTTHITAVAIDPNGNTSEFSACETAQADLAITNMVSGTPLQGAALTYTLNVNKQVGDSDALNTVVTDPLPAQVTFVSATPGQGTCGHNPANNTVTCDLGTLVNDNPVTITINVTVNTALTVATFTNTASVTSDTPDPTPGNNSASQSTTVPQASLTLTQMAAPNPVAIGSTLTYTFKITNLGPIPATTVRLHDALPANVTFKTANAGAGACTPGSGGVDCTLTSLSKGAVWTVTIAVSPNAGTQNTTLNNTGTVSAEQVDLVLSNNTAVSNVKANIPPVPAAPILLSPANAAPTKDTTPTLAWNPALYAVDYEVQIAGNSTFTTGLQTASSPVTNYTPPSDLAEGTYYWRVRAKNILDVYGAFSVPRSFSVDTTPLTEKTALLTPAAGAFVSMVRPSFTWKPVTGAKQYRIQVDDDPQFGSPVINELVVTTRYVTPANAVPLPQGLYYWQVLAIDPAGNEGSNWSNPRQFTVFIGTAPANGSFNAVGKPIFTWAAVSGTTTYNLEIAYDSGFTSYVFGYPLPVSRTTYTPVMPLPKETTLYWRVLRSGETPVSIAYRTLFIAAAPGAPKPLSPLNSELLKIATPTLSWTLVTPPNGVTLADYEIQLARTAAFTTGLTTLTSATTSATTPTLAEGMWYWRARARFGADALPGAWSLARSFTIDTVPPEPPKLSAPSMNPVVSTEQPRLIWVASPGATSYRVDIADNANFTNPIVNDQIATTTSFTPTCSTSNAVVLRWLGFQNFGIVNLELDNRGGVPAKLTNFRINWNQMMPGVLTLARVSVVAPPGDPGAVIIWQASSPAQDATPPTIGKTKIGWPSADAGWVQDVVIPAHTVIPVYVDFDGEDSTLDTIGMTPQDFNNTSFDVGCAGTGGAINLAQGHYWWRVRAVDKAGNTSGDSLTGQFTIFIGTAPADGSFNPPDKKPTFTWTPVAGATGYKLQIATDTAFSNMIADYPLPVNTTSYTLPTALSGTLYWRVIPNGEVPVSSIYRTLFIGAAPAAPKPDQPLNGAVVHTVTPPLTWGVVTPPDGVVLVDYEIQLARSATFTTGLVTLNSGTPDVTTGTLATGLWYWRVRARFGPGALPGAWSAVRSFTVKIP